MKFYFASFLVLIIFCLISYLLSTFEIINIFASEIKNYIINSRRYKHFMIIVGRLFRLSIVLSAFASLLFFAWIICVCFYIVICGVFYDQKSAVADEPVAIQKESIEPQNDPSQKPRQNENNTNSNGRIRVRNFENENDLNMT